MIDGVSPASEITQKACREGERVLGDLAISQWGRLQVSWPRRQLYLRCRAKSALRVPDERVHMVELSF